MAKKRNAAADLNQFNWDQEEPKEDPGIFTRANEEILQNRIMKRARRRTLDGDGEPVTKSLGISPFARFKGFANQKPETLDIQQKRPSLFNGHEKNESTFQSNVPLQSSVTQPKNEYCTYLKELNETFLKWINECITKNPYCDMTPVLEDYGKHIKDLQTKFNSKTVTSGANNTFNKDSLTTGMVDKTNENKKATTVTIGSNSLFASKMNTDSSNVSPLKKVSDPAVAPSLPAFQGFGGFGTQKPSFGAASLFSFSSAVAAEKPEPVASQQTTEENETEEPPESDYTPVAEEDALYSKKCKLFYKKKEEFVVRGVGNLHLKKVNDKLQLIIRADTTQGNVLLNILMNSSIPVSRTGKNNVVISCIPNPPINPENNTPTTFLIRVKTTEDADELLQHLQENV